MARIDRLSMFVPQSRADLRVRGRGFLRPEEVVGGINSPFLEISGGGTQPPSLYHKILLLFIRKKAFFHDKDSFMKFGKEMKMLRVVDTSLHPLARNNSD